MPHPIRPSHVLSALAMMLFVIPGVRAQQEGWKGGGDASDFALGIKAGTTGLGAEATLGVNDYIGVRLGVNTLDFSFDKEINDIDYDVQFDYLSVVGLLDLYPFGDFFRLTAGVVANDNTMTLDATPKEPITIGDTRYPAAAVGTIRGEVEFEDVAPYLGIGFGNPARSRRRVSVTLDLGVVLQSYEVTLTADGPIAQFPGFQEDLEAEAKDVEDELNDWEIYPVLALGLHYRF